MMKRIVGLVVLLALGVVAPVDAITVYPIDRAEILTGARFDLKVEFDRVLAAGDVRVTINGESYEAALGQPGRFVDKEDGVEASALIVRDVALARPGAYTVTATGCPSSVRSTTACRAPRCATRWASTTRPGIPSIRRPTPTATPSAST